jgi:hypothetical protein
MGDFKSGVTEESVGECNDAFRWDAALTAGHSTGHVHLAAAEREILLPFVKRHQDCSAFVILDFGLGSVCVPLLRV